MRCDNGYRAGSLRLNDSRAKYGGAERGGWAKCVHCEAYGFCLCIREMHVIRPKFLLVALMTFMLISILTVMVVMLIVTLTLVMMRTGRVKSCDQ